MAMEFFDFLRAFWHREVAILRPESGGQWDRDAQQIIWTIKIAAEDATVFEAHRSLFELLAERFFGATPRGEAPPQINYTEILAAIHQIQPQRQWEQSELIRIIQIVHKMRTVLYNLRFANVALQDFRFAPIRHSPPQESRCPLIEAWRAYTDGHPLSTDTPIALRDLNSIYQIGLCRAIGEGRSGVLSALPGEREWSRVRDFLGVLRTRIRTVLESSHNAPVLCRVQTEANPGVTAEADMVIGTTAWFFVAGDQTAELQRLDRFLMVLLTVYGLRKAGHDIRNVCLFQMITGSMLEVTVEDWSESASSLLVAFIQARVQHTIASHT